MVRILGCFLSLLILALPVAGRAGELEVRAGGVATVYSEAELEALGMSSLVTTTSWTDGPQSFDGVLLSRIAEVHGVKNGMMKVTAINGYEAELEVSELLAYPVLLATRQNGKRMPLREKGPFWIVYPRDEFPEFNDERHNYKWVWQVRSLEFQ